MKKFVVCCFALMFVSGLSAEEATFLSLTRRPTPLDRLPSNIAVITREEIEQSGAQTLDQVLILQPSIHSNRTGEVGSFSSLRMRGIPNSAQMSLIVDDQPYGGISADQIVDFSQISTANIDRIEIVRGGSSVLYGANTTGGIIHVITKGRPKNSKEVSLGYEAGSFHTQTMRLSAGASDEHTDGLVTASQMTTDGFQRNSDANNKFAAAEVGRSFSNGGRISLHVANADNSVGVPQGTSIPLSDWDGNKERAAVNLTNQTDQRRLEGRIKLESPLGKKGFVQSTFFGSNSNYRNHNGAGAFDTPYEKNTHVLGNDTRFLLGQGSTLGVAYERDEYKDMTLDLIHVTDLGLYAEQELDWGRVNLIPAVRYDHHSNFGNQVSPRLTTVIRPVSIWALSFNASRSFRAPSFFDLYGDYIPTNFLANRNLKPETAWTFDVGNQVRLGSHELKITGYYTKIRDRIARIDPTNDGSLNDTNANVSQAELNGIEVEFHGEAGPFFHRGNYTFQRARENSVSQSKFVDIALTPAHMANYVWGWKTKSGFSQTQTWHYVSKQYERDNRAGRKLASYGVWHIRLAQTIKMIEIYGGVNNILDKRYAEAFDFDTVNFVDTVDPLPGRTYFGGINLHFGSGEN